VLAEELDELEQLLALNLLGAIVLGVILVAPVEENRTEAKLVNQQRRLASRVCVGERGDWLE
jgi:hypothetical protein